MMYTKNANEEKFVTAVLVNGIPQKELKNGSVILPFNTEYVLRFRNKNKKRAIVRFFIDGESVSGNGYVIGANSYIDIKRHHDTDTAFKFVDLESPDAIDHGKNGSNHDKQKGVIEARFFLEKEKLVPNKVIISYPPLQIKYKVCGCPVGKYCNCYIANHKWSRDIYVGGVAGGGINNSIYSDNLRTYNQNTDKYQSRMDNNISRNVPSALNNTTLPHEIRDGCTVEGSSTGQNFTQTFIDFDESSYTTIKLFLQGQDKIIENNTQVKQSPKVGATNLSSQTVNDVNAQVAEFLEWVANNKQNGEVNPKSSSTSTSSTEQDALNALEKEMMLLRIKIAEAKAAKLRKELEAELESTV